MKEHVCMKCGKILESKDFDKDEKDGNIECHVCVEMNYTVKLK